MGAEIVAVARSYCFMHQKVGLTPMRVPLHLNRCAIVGSVPWGRFTAV